jgi:hypothetical protein
VLKNVEQRFPGVLVRAIHDDTTILGDTEMIFSEEGARQQLATDLANVGSELHEGKAEAYEMTPEDRAQIPEGIKQPSETWTDPVTGISKLVLALWIVGSHSATTPKSSRRSTCPPLLSAMIFTALFKASRKSAAMLPFRWPTTHACTVRTF